MKKLDANYQFSTSIDVSDLEAILQLQQINLEANNTPEEIASQGFVTVQHDFDLLESMSNSAPPIIAKYQEAVVGYALVMLQKFKAQIPVLFPMFEMIDQLNPNGQSLKDSRYFVMGQICIAKLHRSKGLFDGLYQQMKKHYQTDFDYVITEVATRNQRSLQAHFRVGFKTIKSYTSPDGESWELILWDWE